MFGFKKRVNWQAQCETTQRELITANEDRMMEVGDLKRALSHERSEHRTTGSLLERATRRSDFLNRRVEDLDKALSEDIGDVIDKKFPANPGSIEENDRLRKLVNKKSNEVTTLACRCSRLEKELKEISDERDEYKRGWPEVVDLKKIVADSNIEQERLQGYADHAKKRIVDLKAQLRKAESVPRGSEMRIDELTNQVVFLNGQIDKKDKQLLGKEANIKTLGDQVIALNFKVDEHAGMICAQSATIRELFEAKKELKIARSDYGVCVDTNAKILGDRDAIADDLANRNEENIKLRMEIKALQENRKKHDGCSQFNREVVWSMGESISQWKAKHRKACDERNALQVTANNLGHAYDLACAEATKLRENYLKLERKYAEDTCGLKSNIRRLERVCGALKDEVDHSLYVKLSDVMKVWASLSLMDKNDYSFEDFRSAVDRVVGVESDFNGGSVFLPPASPPWPSNCSLYVSRPTLEEIKNWFAGEEIPGPEGAR
ncbi:MAG: hypothetical protein GY906_23785 [bacterium]|nr:hypothetical protein [bacterium]